MFRKKFSVKNKNPVKSRERKIICDAIQKQYPSLSEEYLKELLQPTFPLIQMKLLCKLNTLIDVFIIKDIPIFFRLTDTNDFIPTVFTLWKCSNIILPSFTTHFEVWNRIENGADLMSPGLIRNCDDDVLLGTGKKGDICSVNINSNRFAHAVGVLEMDVKDVLLQNSGKFIKIYHTYTDELAKMCSLILPIEDTTLTTENEVSVSTETETNNETEDEKSEADSSKDLSEEEQTDILFRYCAIKAFRTNGKNIKLPMLVSTFYKNEMMAVCPSNCSLDVKKSSYKKLTKFLEVLEQCDIIKTTNLKNVQSIITINMTHPEIIQFRKWDWDVTEKVVVEEPKTKNNIIQGYTITTPTFCLFADAGLSRGKNLTVEEIRKHLTNYVKKNNLAAKRFVTPNNAITSVCNTTEKIEWETLFTAVMDRMTPWYSVDQTSVKKGKLSPIIMSIQNRKGNKKVTLVDNLDVFDIDLHEFSHECQIGLGTSATIIKSASNKSQLLVQGNQIIFIYKQLTTKYNIKPCHIRGAELAPKKK